MRDCLLSGLELCDTDVEGALRRFSGDEDLYVACLLQFLKDPTMNQLDTAIKKQHWDDAFTAAHALKGVAGNMGFIPLFHATAELVVLIRTGKLDEIYESNLKIKQCYRNITEVISKNYGNNTTQKEERMYE